MMKKRKNGWMRKGMIAMVSALTIAASAGTVLAYEPLQSSDVKVTKDIKTDAPEYTNFDFEEYDEVNNEFSESDSIFVSLYGEIVPIYDTNIPKALCKHNMVNGYLKNHISNGSGGCSVKVYTCQRCTRCGYLANSKYDYTVTYTKCPHK